MKKPYRAIIPKRSKVDKASAIDSENLKKKFGLEDFGKTPYGRDISKGKSLRTAMKQLKFLQRISIPPEKKMLVSEYIVNSLKSRGRPPYWHEIKKQFPYLPNFRIVSDHSAIRSIRGRTYFDESSKEHRELKKKVDAMLPLKNWGISPEGERERRKILHQRANIFQFINNYFHTTGNYPSWEQLKEAFPRLLGRSD